MKTLTKLWLPVLIYAILIFWISSFDRPFNVALNITNIDKFLHLLEYAVFGFLLIRAVKGSNPSIPLNAAIILTFVIGAFYGMADELHQSVVPGREAAVIDFLFDSLGSFTGAAAFILICKKSQF